MFGKIFSLFIIFIYVYLIVKGIQTIVESKMCKKYYLKNRNNCKCFTCRFYKNCKNSVTNLGEKNELDI